MPEEKTGRRLMMNDGTTIENGEAGFSSGYLWMWVPEMTMPEAAALFFDQEKTKRILFQYGDMEDEYTDFTVCTHLSVVDEKVTVCMTKGGNT